MSLSLSDDGNTLSLTERHLFSLFARYPEIAFDLEDQDTRANLQEPQAHVDEVNSSPASTATCTSDHSLPSTSTARTTPLRPLYLLQVQRLYDTDTVADYLRRLRQTDLPEECRLCFASLAQSIGAISSGMTLSTNGRYRLNNTYFIDQCSILLREARTLSNHTKVELKRVDGLKSMIIFKVVPTETNLWAIYRQRSALIIKNTALPCYSELYLISRLARLYNSVIYHPIQDLIDEDELEAPTVRMLNDLYDALFTWLSYYRQWFASMKDLKQQYVTPLIERVVASSTVRADIATMRRAKDKMEAALASPLGPSMLPVDERVLAALNLSSRRKEAVARVPKLRKMGRIRREKTI